MEVLLLQDLVKNKGLSGEEILRLVFVCDGSIFRQKMGKVL